MQNMKASQQGQALLIVVLVVVLVLSVALSVVSRSVTNVHTTTQEDTTQRAFSAAEAGIEKAIKPDPSCPLRVNCTNTFVNQSGYNYSISSGANNKIFLHNGTSVDQDDGADLWLVNWDSLTGKVTWVTSNWQTLASQSIDVYFGSTTPGKDICSTTSNTMPALEVIAITGDGAVTPAAYKSDHFTYDPCPSGAGRTGSSGDSSGNNNLNFPVGKVTGSNGPFAAPFTSFAHRATFSVTDGIMLRVIPLYASSIMAVSGSIAFPSQGNVIQSSGTAFNADNSSQTTRKVTYYQSVNCPPELCQYSLYIK